MPPATLFTYLARRMIYALIGLAAALAGIVFLADFIENLRFAGKVGAGFAFALEITLLRLPGIAQSLLPFIFLFGAIWMFTQLNRRSEIAVMRSAGLSAWRLIAPAAFIAGLFGFAVITLLDPISARMMAYGDKLKLQSRGQNASSLVRVFGDGIWLRQRDNEGTLVINAASFDEARGILKGVTIWRLGADAEFNERIDAPEASFSGRTIELKDALMKSATGAISQRTPKYSVPTSLTLDDLRQNTPAPETMSVWDLPHFILLAEAAGLPTVRYNIRFHDLCATPLKLTAMVLIAALFSLGPMRSGDGSRLLLLAVAAGFALYIFAEVSNALGESGFAPPILAAWTPALVATIFAVTMMMRFEEA